MYRPILNYALSIYICAQYIEILEPVSLILMLPKEKLILRSLNVISGELF